MQGKLSSRKYFYVTPTSAHTMHLLLNNWQLSSFWSNVVSSVTLLSDEQVLHPSSLPPVSTREERLAFSVTETMSMEGEAEESDEDVQKEDKPTVLWEKCIQQSIFVDLSEDESLHLSDLESSLALHLSQAESAASDASIHLDGKSKSPCHSFFSPVLARCCLPSLSYRWSVDH